MALGLDFEKDILNFDPQKIYRLCGSGACVFPVKTKFMLQAPANEEPVCSFPFEIKF